MYGDTSHDKMPPSLRSARVTRGFSTQLRLSRQRTETESLLALDHDEENHADRDGLYPPNCTWTNCDERPPQADPYRNANCTVYENIIGIRMDIIASINDPYSLEQLKAPRMITSVVRPLVDSLYEKNDLSIVYCLLVNRMQFIREQSYMAHNQTVNLTRALLCEIIAEKILRQYNELNPGPRGLLKLANILVASFDSFQGAPEEVYMQSSHARHWAAHLRAGKVERKITALEVAIISSSKSFLASNTCQKIIEAIYHGKIVYTPSSFVDIIPDHWKKRPISLYDPRKAPLLNQYRLVVPRTRNLIEICQFVVLLTLYITFMIMRESRNNIKYSFVEAVFGVYAAGWVLDQFASILEHGWGVYTQNLWAFLDITFVAIFMAYSITRVHSASIFDADDSLLWARTSLDILGCAGPVLIPRLAFTLNPENMLFLSLRAMMSDFFNLTALAVWCFAGFLLSLKWLHSGAHQSVTIGKWMIWIWFGLDGTGINESPDFHWLFGPLLMVLFAFLGNTLFLTVLVSMLTNTFSDIAANAVQEIQFRRSVLTFLGVKSDAIFAYMPPFNILALIFMLPLKCILSERMFHKVNVTAVRIINFPVLLIIAWYERRTLWVSDKGRERRRKKIDWKNSSGPKATLKQYWAIKRFNVHGDVQAVFDIEPPQSVLDRLLLVRAAGRNNKERKRGATMRNGYGMGLQRWKAKGYQPDQVLPVNRKNAAQQLGAGSNTGGDSGKVMVESPGINGAIESDSDTSNYPASVSHEKLDSIAQQIHAHEVQISQATAELQSVVRSIEKMENLLLSLLAQGNRGVGSVG